MRLLVFLASTLFIACSLQAQAPMLMNNEDALQISVQNRILAKVNGKAITVMDLMKKMDMVFYRQFPEYVSSKTARFQFYMMNWKQVLQDLIDKELLLADAEEMKMVVNNGDVRQEMEQTFGPNIIANLDKAGLTMEEACQMMKEEITIRRMLMMKVNMKAIKKVNPNDIRASYEKYVKEHVKTPEWTYQVISIRHPDASYSAEVAAKIYTLLSEVKCTLEELSPKLNEDPSIDRSIAINVSQEMHHKELEVSPAFKEILVTLTEGGYSAPVAQKSRDNSTVYRVFYLKKKNDGTPPSFAEIANELKDKLISEAVDQETESYLTKLRQHFALDQEQLKMMIPDHFQPFVLEQNKGI